MTRLSSRLDKLEGGYKAERLITVAVDNEAQIAPLLAIHGIEERPTDLIVSIPSGGEPPRLLRMDGEVYGCGHRLEEVLAERANGGPLVYALPPMASA